MTVTVTRTTIALDAKPVWVWWRLRDWRYRRQARRMGVAYAHTTRFYGLPKWWLLGLRYVEFTSPVYGVTSDGPDQKLPGS